MPRLASIPAVFSAAALLASLAFAEDTWMQGGERLGAQAGEALAERFPPPEGRPLTPAEIALSSEYFGAAVEYPKIRISVWKDCSLGCPMKAVARHEIRMPRWAYERDYAGGRATPYMRCVFVHEMTHLYQHEHLGGFVQGVYGFIDNVIEDLYPWRYPEKDKYNYVLDLKRHWLDYGIEQQASIVEDYCRLQRGEKPVRLKGTEPPAAEGEWLAFYRRFLAGLLADPARFVDDYFERRRRMSPGPPWWPRG